MKITKFPLFALAIILGAGGAFAHSFTKKEVTQYYLTSTGKYLPAGIEGYDYKCEFDHFGTCTYYYDESTNTYKPSKSGKIVFYR
jgi:hypothetical protein